MKRSMVAATVAVLAAAGLAAFAQQQGGRPGAGQRAGGPQFGGILRHLATDPKAAEELGLTPEQVEKLKAKTEEMKAGHEETMAKLRAAEEAQRKLMQSDTLDEAALLKGIETIGALRTDMAKQEINALAAVHSILTPEQIQKVRARMHERVQQQGQGVQRRERGGTEGRGEGTQPPPPAPAAPPAE